MLLYQTCLSCHCSIPHCIHPSCPARNPKALKLQNIKVVFSPFLTSHIFCWHHHIFIQLQTRAPDNIFLSYCTKAFQSLSQSNFQILSQTSNPTCTAYQIILYNCIPTCTAIKTVERAHLQSIFFTTLTLLTSLKPLLSRHSISLEPICELFINTRVHETPKPSALKGVSKFNYLPCQLVVNLLTIPGSR